MNIKISKNHLYALGLCMSLIGSQQLYCAASSSTPEVVLQALTGTTGGRIALATTAALASSSAVHLYRTSRPVAPPILEKCDYKADTIATLFVHGLGADGASAHHFKSVLPGTVYTFDFPDAPERSSSLAHTGIGQPVEVRHLKNALQQLGDKADVEKIFLFGISRGGATLVNLLKETDIPHMDKIDSVMIESSFANLDDIITLKLQQAGVDWIPGLRWAGHALVKALYNQYSLFNQPIDDLDRATIAAKALPIFMLCSRQDQLIPASSTERLSARMGEVGFNAIEHHTVDYGPHGNILWGGSAEEYRHRLANFIAQRFGVDTEG